MRVWLTADIHHPIDRAGEGLLERLAAQIQAEAAPEDVVLLAGDLAGVEGHGLDACLAAFSTVGARRAFVPGNHDLWVRPEGPRDSFEIYEAWLPEIGARHGFDMLDHAPLRVPHDAGVLGIVGTYGGYDFTLADTSHLADPALVRRGWETGWYQRRRWNDYRYCLVGPAGAREPLEPAPFCARMLARFDAQLAELQNDPEVTEIVAITHTVAHPAQVADHPRGGTHDPGMNAWFFGLAGCRGLGEAISRAPKVQLAFCGHSHQLLDHTDASGRRWLNGGSNYRHKCWWTWAPGGSAQHRGWHPALEPSPLRNDDSDPCQNPSR